MAQDIGTSNLVDVWASAGSVTEPDISKKDEGWQLGEQPPHEYMNWLQNTFGEKLNHVLSRGGVDWNSETPWPVGAKVIRNGRRWRALVANSNSEPTAANTNWADDGVAESIDYDNTASGLTADDVKSAIDELQSIKISEKYQRSVTVDFASDADLTLTTDQNLYGNLTLTDTGVALTAARNVIVSDAERDIVVTNSTAQDLTVKTAAGTGITILAGTFDLLRSDGTNVVRSAASGLGVGQTWQDVAASRSVGVTYTNTTGKPIEVAATIVSNQNDNLTMSVDGIARIREYMTAGQTHSINLIIPSGSSYTVSIFGTPTITYWSELR